MKFEIRKEKEKETEWKTKTNENRTKQVRKPTPVNRREGSIFGLTRY